jgi:hypothetical protein
VKPKQGFSAPRSSQLAGPTTSFGFTVANNARRDDPASTTTGHPGNAGCYSLHGFCLSQNERCR